MHRFVALLFLLVVILIYASYINNQRFLDDQHAVALFVDGVAQAEGAFSFLSNTGLLGRPVSMLAFWIESRLFGGTYAVFKVANLVLHILCFFLILGLMRKVLTRSTFPAHEIPYISWIISLSWLVCSIHVSTVLYASQQMAIWTAFFMLLSMLVYISGREQIDTQSLKARLKLYVLVPMLVALATLSKENGLLALPLIALIEICFFRFRSAKGLVKDLLVMYVVVVVALVVLLLTHDLVPGLYLYTDREFTAYERVLTESRILWNYVLSILIYIPSGFGYFHDDVLISKNLLQPLSTLFSVLAWLFVIVFSFVLVIKRKQVWLAFGALFFLIAHFMESTFIGLELYFEHRNYLASLGIVMLVTIGLWKLLKDAVGIKYVHVFFAGCLLAQLIFLVSKVDTWSNYDTGLFISAQNHPESPRTLIELSTYFASQMEPEMANRVLTDLMTIKPELTSSATFHQVLNNCTTRLDVSASVYSQLEHAHSTGYRTYFAQVLSTLAREVEKENCHFQDKAGFVGVVYNWALVVDEKSAWVADEVVELLLALGANNQAAEILHRYKSEGIALTPASYLLMLELLLSQDRCMDAVASLGGIESGVLSEQQRSVLSDVKGFIEMHCRN